MFSFSENFKLGVYATLVFIPIAFWIHEDTKRDLQRCHDLNNKIIANQKVISDNQKAITERIFRNDPVIVPEHWYGPTLEEVNDCRDLYPEEWIVLPN